jgi:hypothetical protein
MAAAMPPPAPKAPKRRGRPPIHLSASLNLVLPSQLFPEFVGESRLSGEKRLMLAVLSDAIDIFLKHGTSLDARGRRLFAETADWIFSDDAMSPFSFINVCETLGLSPSCLRRGLRRLDARRSAAR